MATDTASAGSHQGDSLCLQKGYIDLCFMTSSKNVNRNGKTFNLDRSIKSLVIAGRQFNDQFAILSLYGEGNPICRPEDGPNSNDALTGPRGKSIFSAGFRELTDTRLGKEESAAADRML
jgi:hypothetical protein